MGARAGRAFRLRPSRPEWLKPFYPINTTVTPDLGSIVDTNYWVHDSIASAASGIVTLINNTGSDGAIIYSKTVVPTWRGTVLTVPFSITGSADAMDIGILDADSHAMDSSLPYGNSGLAGPGFYGVRIDIWNGTINQVVDGSVGSYIAGSFAPGTFDTMTMAFTDVGGGNMNVDIQTSQMGALGNFTITAPIFQLCRVAIGAWTGGFAGVFRVSDPVTAQPPLPPRYVPGNPAKAYRRMVSRMRGVA